LQAAPPAYNETADTAEEAEVLDSKAPVIVEVSSEEAASSM
jgi:hypothetical protein